VRLEQLCAERGLTLEQLAQLSGVRSAVVARLAAGGGRLHPATLRRLAAELTSTPGELRNELLDARGSRWGPPAPEGSRRGRPGRAPRRPPA
jgi:transcriptional regulator with XRE-family HTH domain